MSEEDGNGGQHRSWTFLTSHARVLLIISRNPEIRVRDIAALADITEAYRELRPDLVHLFTPVCVLLGGIAAARVGVPYRVAALTGLGHVFTAETLKARMARPMLRRLFRRELNRPGTAVIFQNEADQAELVAAGVVEAGRCHLIRGSGVDTDRFVPRDGGRDWDGVRILFASRLLREKGLGELVDAFASVRRAEPSAELWIAGEPYAPNPTSFTEGEVEALAQRDGVRWLGHVEDMAALLHTVDIVTLPSHREGTPKILLEAAACALPLVATDIPGCWGVVEDGVSGFLVPVNDPEALAGRLLELCEDPTRRDQMGHEGRRLMQEHFSTRQVIEETFAVYRALPLHA